MDGPKQRIVQELVPGKQITLAHIIANPVAAVGEKLGAAGRGAIGVLTVSPAETAIIAADIAAKSGGVDLAVVNHLSGSLIVTGSVSEVEAAISAIMGFAAEKLGFETCAVTKT
ncbi:MAG: BMC domain-containing protein [Clostridiales bacterium]|jgi:ethanolamine utilization protein EutS|nr:BMC domain-containing protein [Clostridiales bacterium]